MGASKNRHERASAARARSAGTGMYTGVHEDSEHRTRPDHARAVDY